MIRLAGVILMLSELAKSQGLAHFIGLIGG